jgi:hypothetical protein
MKKTARLADQKPRSPKSPSGRPTFYGIELPKLHVKPTIPLADLERAVDAAFAKRAAALVED